MSKYGRYIIQAKILCIQFINQNDKTRKNKIK